MEKDKHLQPICLPKGYDRINTSDCYATGWGDTEYDGHSSTVLQEVRLPIMDDNYCRKSRIHFRAKYNPELMLCSGYEEGGRDTCQGDSGGPLVCPTFNGVWIQYGITSFGYECARRGNPGISTRVSRYIDWIEENIQKESRN
jgi:secreted trypsin-like serine protease